MSEWARVQYDPEAEKWEVVRVSELVIGRWDSYGRAAKYADACGFDLVLGVPHFCLHGCTHGPLFPTEPVGPESTT